MIIIEDTRNQPGKHKNINAYMEKRGHKVVRSKMLVGDYQLANDGSIAIDTKSGVMELIVRVIVSFLVALLGGTEAIYAAEVLAWVGSTSYLMYHYYRLSKHDFNHKEAYHGKRTDA